MEDKNCHGNCNKAFHSLITDCTIKIGIKKFNNYCRSKVLGYSEEWEKVIRRIGRWVDMDNPYKRRVLV